MVQEFDHSGCQSWVGKFYCTPDYALYAPHSVAIIHATKLMLYRAIKACLRGWTLCITDGEVDLVADENKVSSFSKTSFPFTFDLKIDNTVIFDTAVVFKYEKRQPNIVYTQDIDDYCMMDYTDYHRKAKFTKWSVDTKVYKSSNTEYRRKYDLSGVMKGIPVNDISGYHISQVCDGDRVVIPAREYRYIDLRGKCMPYEDIGSRAVNVGETEDETCVFECVDYPGHHNIIKAWL